MQQLLQGAKWCAVGTVSTGVLVFLYHALVLNRQRSAEPPLRWSWLPWLGFALEMGSRPIELLQEGASLHRDIFGMVIGGHRMFIVSDPFSTAAILKGPKELSFDEFSDSILNKFFDIPLDLIHKHFTKDFENEMRKMYSQYLLGDKSLSQLTQRIHHRLLKTFKILPTGNVPLFDFISKVVHQASMAALFNEELAEDTSFFKDFCDHDKNLPLAAAGVHINNFSASKAGKDRLVNAFLHCRDNLCDFMNARWNAFTNGPHKLPLDQIGKLQLAIHWASVGNTMPTCFWLIFYLIRSPSILERVRNEIKLNIKDLSLETVSQDELNQLLFLDACFTETLRLASGSLVMRVAKAPCTISMASGKSYNIRKGDRIGLCPALFHLDDELFPNPKTFDPDRWMQGDTFEERSLAVLGKIPLMKNGKEIMSSQVFIPFGAGASYCPGRRFSRNQIKLIVVMLLSNYNFSIDGVIPPIDGSRAGLGVFPPQHDIMATINLI